MGFRALDRVLAPVHALPMELMPPGRFPAVETITPGAEVWGPAAVAIIQAILLRVEFLVLLVRLRLQVPEELRLEVVRVRRRLGALGAVALDSQPRPGVLAVWTSFNLVMATCV